MELCMALQSGALYASRKKVIVWRVLCSLRTGPYYTMTKRYSVYNTLTQLTHAWNT
jgi:hypothetical protein